MSPPTSRHSHGCNISWWCTHILHYKQRHGQPHSLSRVKLWRREKVENACWLSLRYAQAGNQRRRGVWGGFFSPVKGKRNDLWVWDFHKKRNPHGLVGLILLPIILNCSVGEYVWDKELYPSTAILGHRIAQECRQNDPRSGQYWFTYPGTNMVRLLIYFPNVWTFRELHDSCRWHGEMYLFGCGMNKWRAHVSHERRWIQWRGAVVNEEKTPKLVDIFSNIFVSHFCGLFFSRSIFTCK